MIGFIFLLIIPSATGQGLIVSGQLSDDIQHLVSKHSSDSFIVTSLNNHGLMPLIAGDDPSGRSGEIAQATLSLGARYGTFQEDWCRFGGSFDTIVKKERYSILRIKNVRSKLDWLLDRVLNTRLLAAVGMYCEVNSASGLTIISPSQLTDVQQIPFEVSSGVDSLARKSILCGKSELDDLSICTTHLQAGGNVNDNIRVSQIETLDTVLEELLGYPLILTGDFNVCSHDVEGLKLPDARKLAWLIGKHGLMDVHSGLDGNMRCRKDFIFQRGLTLIESSIKAEQLSDHPLLEARFEEPQRANL